MDLGEIKEARAALAFRTACSVMICYILGTIASDHTSEALMNSHSQAALLSVMAFMVSTTLLGATCKMSFTLGLSSLVLVPLGIGVGFLCYLVGGMEWRAWILSIGLGVSCFLAVLWGAVAESIQPPRALPAGPPLAIMLLPGLALQLHNNTDLLLNTACMTAYIILGLAIALLFSWLPLVGAEPAWRHMPALAARLATVLAEMCEVVTIWQTPTTAALLRHRECRLRLLKTLHEFRLAQDANAFELWQSGNLSGFDWARFSSATESCRLSLNMKSGILALGFDPVHEEIWYRGPLGEAMRQCCLSASAALRSSSSRLAATAGVPPPAQVPAAPWLASDHATAGECEEAAEKCRRVLGRYLAAWQNEVDGRERIEEALQKANRPRTGSASPMTMFLSGRHLEVGGLQLDEARMAAFDEACRHAACFLGVCNAAKAAAEIATIVAQAKETSGHCIVGCSWLSAWLRAPFACSAWPKAFAKVKSFAFRLAVAQMMIALICVFVEPNSVWPSKKGPLWTLFTIVLIITPVQGASLLRSLHRILGTCFGSLLALASIALTGTVNARTLSSHIFLLALVMKFFEPELQYTGAVSFITFIVVMSNISDSTDFSSETEMIELTWSLTLRRCCDVLAGVLAAMVVSIFVAPDRAVDALRLREETALQTAASVIRAAARHLALRAKGQQPGEEPWSELHKETVTSFEGLNFGGDGRAGVADLLADARWESRWGLDGGKLVLGGLLWLPWCSKSAHPGRRRLEVVETLSRLLRLANLLISVLQPGLGEDAERLLSHDRRVVDALGPEAKDFNKSVDDVLSSAVAMLQMPGHCETEDLEAQLRLLLQGCAASRVAAGGLLRSNPAAGGQRALGGLHAAAALKLLQVAAECLMQVGRELEGSAKPKHAWSPSSSDSESASDFPSS
ncbi:unnamed protein product [Effrenium voratum]|nr:unnamed protein product [Effrenium voratum]